MLADCTSKRVTKTHYCFNAFDTIVFIRASTGIKIPIYRELKNHTDEAISKVLEKFGKLNVKEIVE